MEDHDTYINTPAKLEISTFKVEIIHFTSSKIALYSACRKQDLAAVIASVTCSGTSPEYIALSKHECASGAGGKYLGYKKYLLSVLTLLD